MNRIKALRIANKITQDDIAKKLGVSSMSVSRWEKGEAQIKPDKAQALADYFGVDVGYLLGYSDEDYRNAIAHGTVEKPNHVNTLITKPEINLIATYRLLDAENQAMLQDMAQNFLENQVYTDPENMLTIIDRYKLLYGGNEGIDKLYKQINLLISISKGDSKKI